MVSRIVTRLSWTLVALLLLTFTAVQVSSEAAVTVLENEVEWAAANGDDIAFVKPDTTARFYIRDDALETTKLGTRVFTLGATAPRGEYLQHTQRHRDQPHRVRNTCHDNHAFSTWLRHDYSVQHAPQRRAGSKDG